MGEKGVRLRYLKWPFLRLFFARGDRRFLECLRSRKLSMQAGYKRTERLEVRFHGPTLLSVQLALFVKVMSPGEINPRKG